MKYVLLFIITVSSCCLEKHTERSSPLYSLLSNYNINDLSAYKICILTTTKQEGCDICISKANELIDKYKDRDSLLVIMSTRHSRMIERKLSCKNMIVDSLGIAINDKLLYGYPKVFVLEKGEVVSTQELNPATQVAIVNLFKQ